ncbi:MAG TPA: PAS domain-containing sensor histidine kinase [Polyangiaceae bacterium]|nr:PAS domain-containing sensor histidine kinase [Polyangiaceae bacterium]
MSENEVQADQLYRLLVDTVQDYAIYALDSTGHVATWNRGAERLKGWTAKEVIGQHVSRFYLEEDVRAGKCERELEGAIRDGRFEDEGWRVRKDGSLFWANVVITTLRGRDGEVVGFAKVTRDLTNQKKAEAERIGLAQAEEAVRLRDEFLSIASHELRTPLTGLNLQVHGLSELSDKLDPKILQKVKRIERSCERLRTLADALLDVSRIATGRFSLRPTPGDLVAAVQEVVDHFSEQAAESRSPLTLEKRIDAAPGEWDMLRIEQAVTNVIENALKYGGGKPVRVTLDGGGGEVTIVVDDEGMGIPEDDMVRIFDRFERAASARHYGGLGLGLYVTRQILMAHGGSVSAENRAGGGARFTMRLPRTGIEPASPKPSPPV